MRKIPVPWLFSGALRAAVLFPCFSLILLFSGCNNSMPSGSGNPPPTVTITANPTSMTAGTSSVLTVTATQATQVTISGGGNSYTLGAAGGTKTVSPTATTTYTATAVGPGGTATATATVTLGPAVPPTVTITANPTSITVGTPAILTVSAANATSVMLSGNDGSSYTLQPNGGMPSVSPLVTTTYTATAVGPGGTTTATATVTVIANPAPTVSITANPTSVTAGSSSILTVTATNATQVTITGGGGPYTLPVSGGTQAVSPGATTTYTATAVGVGGTATATATVTVTPNPAPTVTLTASPASIISGNSSTLTVNATNATQVSISDGVTTYPVIGTSGIQAVSPTATTTYTATATGPGGTTTATTTVTVTANPPPTVTLTANPTSIVSGNSSTLTVVATNATQVTITGGGGPYTLPVTGGTQSVSPTATTEYTATATGTGGTTTATATVTVVPAGSIKNVDHVIFMLQENHTFDNYFGMLNAYRKSNSTSGQAWNIGDDGNTYNVDGIDTTMNAPPNVSDEGTTYPLFKLTSTCIDDLTSSWLESYGDVNRYDFSSTRSILMDGFVHTGENYQKNCASGFGQCAGNFTDTTGKASMGYYDQSLLNYDYYMASQFALSDRWFSPLSSKSISNRIATFTGGTTQGLAFDPGNDDGLTQLDIPNIFQELDVAKVTWKIYYTVTQGACLGGDDCPGGLASYPATNFSTLTYSYQYLYVPKAGAHCTAPTQPSSVVGDSSNSFCIDPDHIVPISQYYTDLANGTLPSFAFIEAGYGQNDEHPGSGQSILMGQQEVAKVINALMATSGTANDEWSDSVFFLSYDEGGGPYDHVPPVPGQSNKYTNTTALGATPPDITSIAVNPDSYNPCLLPASPTPDQTLHCDLKASDPGANSTDAAAKQGFAAQLGFRLPDMVISPFARKHYVSHVPMDHTAVIKFVENRFIGASAHLTARDAVQPNLLNLFNFTNPPWATPPTPPTPVSLTDPASPGYNTCHPSNVGP